MSTSTGYPNGTQPNGTHPRGYGYPESTSPDGIYRYDVTGIQTIAPAAQLAADIDRQDESRFAQVQYWVGSGLTAVIAALTGLVALVITQGILGIDVVLGTGSTLTPISVTEYGLAAAGIALLAGALFAGMIRVAPKPATYYAWLASMVTVLAALLPFTTTATLHSQIALAVTNLVVGLVIAVGIPLAASNARS